MKQSSEFTCFACNQPFSARHAGIRGKMPLVMHCGHSACNICVLRNISMPGESMVCSLCSVTSVASDKYNAAKPEIEFPINMFIMGDILMWNSTVFDDNKITFSLSSKSLASVSTQQACILCHECVESKAQVNCIQCLVPYCDACFIKVHQSARAFKNHIGSPLEDLEAIQVNTKCPIHIDQSKQFWCDDCVTSSCPNCLIAQHNGHSVSLLSDKNISCFKEMMEAHADVVNIQARLKATRKNAVGSLSKLENEEYKREEQQIRIHFARLHGLLIAQEQRLISELYSPSQGLANSIKALLQQIDDKIQELDKDIQLSTALIQNDLKYLSCASYHDVLEHLKSKKSTPCFLLVTAQSKDSVKFVFDENLLSELSNHGEIQFPSSNAAMYKLVCQNELPPNHPIERIKSITAESLKTHSQLLSASGSESVKSESVVSPALSFASLSSAAMDGSQNRDQTPLPRGHVDYGNRNFDELVEGCKLKIIITHAVSPSYFYVRRLGHEKKLLEINQCFSKMTLKTPAKDRIKPGDYYMAQFSQDNCWYRSIVTEVSHNLITVFYIDFGNTETVKRESLRVAPSALKKYDGMAVRCCLADVEPMQEEWGPQAISAMIKILENGEVSVHVLRREEGLLYVDLLRSNSMDVVSLKKALLFLGYARSTEESLIGADTDTFPTALVDKATVERYLPPRTSLPSGYTSEVRLIHYKGPHEFYLQDSKNVETLSQLSKGLLDLYSRRSERVIVYHPKLGMIVAAMNIRENEWRRAKIISVPDYKKVEVEYIDFGDSEVLSFKRIRYLGYKFFKIGIQHYKCRLADVAPIPGSNKWSDEAIERFGALVLHDRTKRDETVYSASDKPQLNMVVHSCCEEDSSYVHLTVLYKKLKTTSLCINTALVKEDLAISTGSNSTVLEIPLDIEQETSPEAGERKRVVRNPSHQISICPKPLDDKRDEENSSHLPDQDSEPPQIYRPRPRKRFMGKSLAASLQEGEGTAASLQQDEDAADDEKRKINYPSGAGGMPCAIMPSRDDKIIKIPVNIIKVVSPSELYIIPLPLLPKINSLKKDLQKFYGSKGETLKLKEFQLNNICVIKRKQEGDFCRAVITKICDSSVQVKLPDLGEVLAVEKDDAYIITDKFKEVRDGAIRCHLGGLKEPLEDRWPMTSTDEILEFVDKYHDRIYITKRGEERDNSLPVEVLMREDVAGPLEPTRTTWTSLNHNLKMRGLALSDGMINWNEEDCKFVTTKQEVPTLHLDVYKGMPLKSSGADEFSQVDMLDSLSSFGFVFGSTVRREEQEREESVADPQCLPGDDSLATLDQSESEKVRRIDGASHVVTMPKEWPSPLPFAYLDFVAQPTNVNLDGSIFIQDFQRSASTLNKIAEILDSNCKESVLMSQDMYWSVGQTCIARYHLDGRWYRGVIKSINKDNTILVDLVDYGNMEEECSVSDLRKIPLATEFPIQGQFCKLKKIKPNSSDGNWTVEMLDTLHSMVVEKHCLVTLSLDQVDNSYCVETMKLPDGSDMLGYLVKQGLAVYNETSCSHNVDVDKATASKVTLAPATRAFQIVSPTQASTSVSSDKKEAVLDDGLDKRSWASECEAFMQAVELLEAMPQEMESVSGRPRQLQPTVVLPENEIRSPDIEVWAKQEQLNHPADLFDISSAFLRESDPNQGEPNYLYLELPLDLSKFEVEVAALTSIDTVAFQVIESDDRKLSHSRERFLELSETLQEEAPSQPQLHFPQPNDACCAQFSGDGVWYRALVVEVPNCNEAIVKYVDYGNMEKLPISQLREIKEEWTLVEVQLFEAKLHNVLVIDKEKNWQRVNYEFQEAVFDRSLIAIVFHKPYLSVELYDENELAYKSLVDSGLFYITKD